MEDNYLQLVLIGESENFISWGLLLSRKGFTLSGVYLPQRWAALASVLLLGCPAYTNIEETAASGNIIFIERSFWAQLSEENKSKMLNLDESNCAPNETCPINKSVVLIDFLGEGPTFSSKEAATKAFEAPNDLQAFVDKTASSWQWYLLKIAGSLSEAGRDILRVDEMCCGRAHEPNPCQDYSLDCSGLSFLLKSLKAEENESCGVKNILEKLLDC
ncbi:MAG: hypothetical protein ACI376_01840 [Candidatus Bruticola sp.]